MGEGLLKSFSNPTVINITMATPKGKSSSARVLSSSLTSPQYIPKTSQWSPLSDAIVERKGGMSEQEQRMKIDEQIKSFLYGKGKSSLPVFDKLCREKC